MNGYNVRMLSCLVNFSVRETIVKGANTVLNWCKKCNTFE